MISFPFIVNTTGFEITVVNKMVHGLISVVNASHILRCVTYLS